MFTACCTWVGECVKTLLIICNITILKIYFSFLYYRYNVTVLCNRRRGKRVRNALAISAVFTELKLDIHARVDTQYGGVFRSQKSVTDVSLTENAEEGDIIFYA